MSDHDKQSPSTACRADGRCQYAIDHGAEGLGHCPVGECVQPSDPADIYEEEYTTQSSVGGTHEHSHRAALAAVVAAISARSAIDSTPEGLARSSAQPAEVGAPVAWMWEYIGNHPYTARHSPVARSVAEMDPANPPYPDSWRPLYPLYGPHGE